MWCKKRQTVKGEAGHIQELRFYLVSGMSRENKGRFVEKHDCTQISYRGLTVKGGERNLEGKRGWKECAFQDRRLEQV